METATVNFDESNQIKVMALIRGLQKLTVPRFGHAAAVVLIAAFGIASPAFAETNLALPLPHVAPATSVEATTTMAAADKPAATIAAPAAGSGDGAVNMDLGGSGDDIEGGGPVVGVEQPAPIDAGPPSDIRPGSFTLEARLAADGPPLGEGVKWRIFGDTPGPDGHLKLLGEASGGIIYIRLDQGTYYVHAAYGRAGATRKIEVNAPTGGEVLVLNAGGVRLIAINGKDQPLAQGDVAFDIYAPDEGGSEERFLLVPNAPPGHVISLNAGTYHIVSKYGDGNAIVRADIKVDPGKLTEATLFQKAARLTLKLVEQHGGEAMADTAWSVTTLAGESVVESVGAFPSVVLAVGDYTAKAKHDGKTYQKNFSVEAGANRDVEVLVE